MPSIQALRPSARRSAKARYVAARPDSPTTPSCFADTVEEMRLQLERCGEPGRYRVFDRRPATRGIDFELVGRFIVDSTGTVLWRPLPRV